MPKWSYTETVWQDVGKIVEDLMEDEDNAAQPVLDKNPQEIVGEDDISGNYEFGTKNDYFYFGSDLVPNPDIYKEKTELEPASSNWFNLKNLYGLTVRILDLNYF